LDIQRLLPQDAYAEQGVLASFLLSPEAVFQLCASQGLLMSHFHIPAHAMIYERLLYLAGERMTIDFITLRNVLQTEGQLENVGGAPFLSDLYTFLPTAANARNYIEIVQEKAALREQIRLGNELVLAAYEPTAKPDMLGSEFSERFNCLGAQRLVGSPLRSIMEIEGGEPDDSKTVLGERFLCVGGGMLFVGPSGVGKSSASAQQDILWALGRPAFGIAPQRPLKILTIQAENDDEDLAEMRDGVCRGLNLTEEDRKLVGERLFYETECSRTGSDFLRYVESRLRLAPFDLLRLDPFQAFNEGDVKEEKITKAFLRGGLNPLLKKYRCACIINHHTPKTTGRDTSMWRGSDWGYAGAGNADMTNWSRAIMVIDPTHADHVFQFIAAKRGGRIGWYGDDCMRQKSRFYCHGSDGLYWREATVDDFNQVVEREAEKKATTKGTLRNYGIRKNDQTSRAKAEIGRFFSRGAQKTRHNVAEASKIKDRTFDRYWSSLKESGLIVEVAAFGRNRGLWQASHKWTTELEGDYPPDQGELA
jgi:replicative DNA helicase